MEQQESGGAGGQIRMMCFKWGAKKYEHLKISFDLLTLHDNKRLVLLVAPYDKVLYIHTVYYKSRTWMQEGHGVGQRP